MTKSADVAKPNMALAADIVAAYVANNTLPLREVAGFVERVYAAILALAAPSPENKPQQSAPIMVANAPVSVRKSITADYLICFEDGKKF